MPEVAGQQFPYTEEGVAAAEEAAGDVQSAEQPIDEQALLEQVMSEIPAEDAEPEVAPEGEPEEDVAAEGVPERGIDEPVVMPSPEVLADLFEVVFGDNFDADDEVDSNKMSSIEAFLSSDPVLSEAVAAGEVGLTEVALKFYRQVAGE